MMPTVSIVIPTFNRAAFVLETVESALAQSGCRVEVIVVDDGSTDNTKASLSPVMDTIKYVEQTNSGVSSARNAGLLRASGEFVIFLDSDDTIVHDKAILQAQFLLQQPDVSVAYSRWRSHRHWEAAPRVVGRNFAGNELPTLFCHNVAVIHACQFRTEAVRSVGGFDPDLERCEDWDLLLRLALGGHRFTFCEHVTADYYRHSGGKSNAHLIGLRCALRLTRRALAHPKAPSRIVSRQASVEALQYLESYRRCLAADPKEAEVIFLAFERSSPELAARLCTAVVDDGSDTATALLFATIDAIKLGLTDDLCTLS